MWPRCLSLSADGLGERLCRYCHADTPRGKRSQTVLPLLARRRVKPLPHLRGTYTKYLVANVTVSAGADSMRGRVVLEAI